MTPLVGIKVDKRISPFGIVRAVEDALLSLTDVNILGERGETCHRIFYVQATKWYAELPQDPWSPNQPTREVVIQRLARFLPVEVILEV